MNKEQIDFITKLVMSDYARLVAFFGPENVPLIIKGLKLANERIAKLTAALEAAPKTLCGMDNCEDTDCEQYRKLREEALK